MASATPEPRVTCRRLHYSRVSGWRQQASSTRRCDARPTVTFPDVARLYSLQRYLELYVGRRCGAVEQSVRVAGQPVDSQLTLCSQRRRRRGGSDVIRQKTTREQRRRIAAGVLCRTHAPQPAPFSEPIHTATPDTTKLSCVCRVRFGGVNGIPDNSTLSPTKNLKSITSRAIVQFTPVHRTRHRQDRLVVSGGRCELGIRLKLKAYVRKVIDKNFKTHVKVRKSVTEAEYANDAEQTLHAAWPYCVDMIKPHDKYLACLTTASEYCAAPSSSLAQ